MFSSKSFARTTEIYNYHIFMCFVGFYLFLIKEFSYMRFEGEQILQIKQNFSPIHEIKIFQKLQWFISQANVLHC